MTNPTNKYSLDEFNNTVKTNCPGILETEGFTGVDNPVRTRCEHGWSTTNGYVAMRRTHCCKIGYYESKKRPLDTEGLLTKIVDNNSNIDISSVQICGDGHKDVTFKNLKCRKHGGFYDVTKVASKRSFVCPTCLKEQRADTVRKHKPYKSCRYDQKPSYVSKTENVWLDSIGVPLRQYWLEDAQYRVDGFDPLTNTVYLYHGKFWHGCPKTYPKEMIHPISKISMGDLYERTMMYEEKIRNMGYNLIVEWG